ncbi:MAG: serine/threonine protein kinase, partial [Akkermansiaceae bacterium]|nr:serine/threonine protein kinase [Akkermansiaceae bacterium]
MAGICHGLAHAHRAGILHRDIKPGNILLGPGAQPKIGDFGLARPVGKEHNPEEPVWGTPGYAAPEVLSDPDAVDQRADIFAVGVLLYELLTARIPSDPWQPPSQIATCDPAFDAVIRRATHPTPEKRYKDAEELATELEALVKKLEGGILRRQPLAAAPNTAPPRAMAPSRPLPVGGRPVPSVSSTPKSQTATILLVLMLIGLLAGAAAIITSAGKGDDQSSDQPVERPPAPPPRKKPDPKPKPPVIGRPAPKPNPAVESPEPAPPPVKPKPVESPTQALTRLKAQLRRGDLSNLPEGAAQRGNSQFFLVDNPLPWQSAAHFAEDH